MKAVWTIMAAMALAGPAIAQDTGGADYRHACASCHGLGGAGDGPLADLLTVAVPDLTTLAARNGGVFPHDQVAHMISGQFGLRGHGDPMPVWGDRFADEAGDDSFGAQGAANARIEALTDYLEVLQK